MRLILISLLLISSSIYAKPFMQLSIGQTFRHQDNNVSELSFVSKNWSIGIIGISEGETTNGYQEFNNIFSLTKTNGLPYNFYTRVGISTVEGSNLVGPWTYRSGVGFRYQWFALEFNHISSGSLYRVNQGIDWLSFAVDF